MRPDDLPLILCHPLEQLRRCLARPSHRLEGGLDGRMGGQLAGESRLVIAEDHRLVLGQKAPDPDRRHHLAVREVMGGLPRGPLAARRAIELLIGDPLECVNHDAVPVAIPRDQPLSFRSVHQTLHGSGQGPRSESYSSPARRRARINAPFPPYSPTPSPSPPAFPPSLPTPPV